MKSGETVTLQIWDTAGQERFQSLSNTFYRGADCCLIVFDITDRESYEGIDIWRNNFIESVQTYKQEQSMSEDESRGDEIMVPIIIVGNKSDL